MDALAVTEILTSRLNSEEAEATLDYDVNVLQNKLALKAC